MVNFENLKIGSRVQTSKDGEIFQGTVRYKGGLITREGNWVGVELDKPGTVLE
jgi:dynactin complex subunit